MQLSERTLQVLKNFAEIDKSLIFDEGSELATQTPIESSLAHAIVTEKFPQAFAIYDLRKFLAAIQMFKTPTLAFHKNYVTISSGAQKINYTYADPTLIKSPRAKTIKLDNIVGSFIVSREQLADILKAVGTMQFPDIIVEGNGKTITLTGKDIKNPSSDVYAIDVGETKNTFSAHLLVANIKILPGAYRVEISNQGLIEFTTVFTDGADGDLQYWIALEAASTFGEQ